MAALPGAVVEDAPPERVVLAETEFAPEPPQSSEEKRDDRERYPLIADERSESSAITVDESGPADLQCTGP